MYRVEREMLEQP